MKTAGLAIGILYLLASAASFSAEIGKPAVLLKSASEVTVPVFIPGEESAAAVIEIGRVSRGHQRRGFFRVAVLPCVSVNRMEIELRKEDAAVEVFERLEEVLQGIRKERALELRNISIVVEEGRRMEMKARRGRRKGDGNWFLEGIEIISGEGKVVFDSGELLLKQGEKGVLKISEGEGKFKDIKLFGLKKGS